MTDIIQLISDRKFDRAKKALTADRSLLAATALDDPDREGVFHEAATCGSVELMKYLIGLGGDFDRAAPAALYMTPLCEAARVGDHRMIELLHRSGARIDGADASALSPLMLAAKSAMPTSVDLLLKCGADPNRLGFVQRYMPLDFADWEDSAECRALIRAASGHSVTDDYDWKSQPGYPIIATVSSEIGAVFPMKLASASHDVSIRVAQSRTKPRAMYVFTDELHEHGRTELAFYLAPTWGILANYRDGMSRQSFPIDVLRTLGALIQSGSLRIREGQVFKRSEPPLAHLAWPDGVSALLATDHGSEKSAAASESANDSADTVDLLVLAPLHQNGAWDKGPKQLEKALASARKARLPKLMLPDPLQARA